NTAVLGFLRYLENERVLCLFNLSDKAQTLPGEFLESIQPVQDLLHPDRRGEEHVRVCQNEPHLLELPSYATCWLVEND
ncbi:MAG: hypothetical protein KC421_12675, partial [Anaerolineales bacterium]|nr:hypothetical protein [Anaerolineales bacterium]